MMGRVQGNGRALPADESSKDSSLWNEPLPGLDLGKDRVRKMSFRNIVEQAGLGINACADVLGVDHELFQQWADGQKQMPPSYASILAAMLGVKREMMTSKVVDSSKAAHRVQPAAIWFKFRGEEFLDADREAILAIRRLGHNANELEQATLGQANRTWDVVFHSIMQQVDIQASPQEQAQVAAKAFCERYQVGHKGIGSSEILRDQLRSQGILIIESSIPNSQVEGCSFYVGDSTAERPCIFVNTYKTTWFRRNVIIMHELGHALFDKTSGGEIDVIADDSQSKTKKSSLVEVRADAFAKGTLLPLRLLMSIFNKNGLKATNLSPEGIAILVADSGVERKTVVEIMFEHSLIDEALVQQYLSYDIAQLLRGLTDHALSTKEYVEKIGKDAAAVWAGKRRTQLSTRPLLLPVPYVKAVVEAVKNFNVSISRAAELLMIDEYTFYKRFESVVAEVSV